MAVWPAPNTPCMLPSCACAHSPNACDLQPSTLRRCSPQFAGYDVPRQDGSRMACRALRRRNPDGIRANCPPTALPVNGVLEFDSYGAQWDLPPSYYQYQVGPAGRGRAGGLFGWESRVELSHASCRALTGIHRRPHAPPTGPRADRPPPPRLLQGCKCLAGYRASWSADGTQLTCVRDAAAALPPWTWVLLALGGALLLTTAGMLFLGSRWALLRLHWMREAELRRKRGLGPPTEGAAATVVITNVDGFSSEWPRGEGAHLVALPAAVCRICSCAAFPCQSSACAAAHVPAHPRLRLLPCSPDEGDAQPHGARAGDAQRCPAPRGARPRGPPH
jgi:hypothetical protein